MNDIIEEFSFPLDNSKVIPKFKNSNKCIPFPLLLGLPCLFSIFYPKTSLVNELICKLDWFKTQEFLGPPSSFDCLTMLCTATSWTLVVILHAAVDCHHCFPSATTARSPIVIHQTTTRLPHHDSSVSADCPVLSRVLENISFSLQHWGFQSYLYKNFKEVVRYKNAINNNTYQKLIELWEKLW